MGRSSELQLEDVKDGKLFVYPVDLAEEEVRLREADDSLQSVLRVHR
jgi:hypothetical protein